MPNIEYFLLPLCVTFRWLLERRVFSWLLVRVHPVGWTYNHYFMGVIHSCWFVWKKSILRPFDFVCTNCLTGDSTWYSSVHSGGYPYRGSGSIHIFNKSRVPSPIFALHWYGLLDGTVQSNISTGYCTASISSWSVRQREGLQAVDQSYSMFFFVWAHQMNTTIFTYAFV